MPPLASRASPLQVFAPLANRLGIWQIKWELEDLSFRFLEPDMYSNGPRLLDEKRGEREMYMQRSASGWRRRCEVAMQAQVQGVPSTSRQHL